MVRLLIHFSCAAGLAEARDARGAPRHLNANARGTDPRLSRALATGLGGPVLLKGKPRAGRAQLAKMGQDNSARDGPLQTQGAGSWMNSTKRLKPMFQSLSVSLLRVGSVTAYCQQCEGA